MRGSLESQLRRLLGDDVDPEEVATKVTGATFAIALLVVVGLAVVPVGSGTSYTEFYVLGEDGTASNYPDEVPAGEPAAIRVGVGNFEGSERTYTLVLRTNEAPLDSRTLTLDSGAVWERPVEVVFDSPGEQLLRLELYEGDEASGEPYRSLRLFVEVSPR